jgi:hypothetical protein
MIVIGGPLKAFWRCRKTRRSWFILSRVLIWASHLGLNHNPSRDLRRLLKTSFLQYRSDQCRHKANSGFPVRRQTHHCGDIGRIEGIRSTMESHCIGIYSHQPYGIGGFEPQPPLPLRSREFQRAVIVHDHIRTRTGGGKI